MTDAVVCTGCGVTHCPTDARRRKRGLRCHACERAHAREWRASRRAAGLPVRSGRMSADYQRQNGAERSKRPAVRARRAEQARARRRLPEEQPRIAAREAVRNAIRRGEMRREACEVCGAHRSEAHHDDYTKPLVVRWLCRRHHIAHHARARGET